MHIIAHRGLWTNRLERNSKLALRRALDKNFGIETDLRDYRGRIVLSHDIPDYNALPFDDFLNFYSEHQNQPILALNVKADGLQDEIAKALSQHKISNYFLFDMSVPDTLGYLVKGLNVFTRNSDFENGSLLDKRSQGLWLDAFDTSFVDPELLYDHAAKGRKVAIVSPELHNKLYNAAWIAWKAVYQRLPPKKKQNIMICTDLPDLAKDFFLGIEQSDD